jgi:hypothetical protein
MAHLSVEISKYIKYHTFGEVLAAVSLKNGNIPGDP